MRNLGLLMISVVIISASCSPRNDLHSKENAVEVTKDYLRDVVHIDPSRLNVKVDDLGEKWKITYFAEPGSTGSPTEFIVNKTSGKIED